MMRDRDRRIHADALRRHWRSNQARQFKRHAIILAGSIALGGLALPYLMLTPATMQATGTWYVARLKTWISSGTDADPGVMIGGGGERYEASARAVAAHPYFRRSADTVIAFVIRGCWLGFGAWLSGDRQSVVRDSGWQYL